jgi:hypothetical protein
VKESGIDREEGEMRLHICQTMTHWMSLAVTVIIFLGMIPGKNPSLANAMSVNEGISSGFPGSRDAKIVMSSDPTPLSIQDRVSSLSVKVDPSNVPIFEFGREMTQILEAISEADATSVDPLLLIEIEATFQNYMDLLKAFYLESFVNYESEIGDSINVNREESLQYVELLINKRDYIMTECRKAMDTAVPVAKDLAGLPKGLLQWNFEVSGEHNEITCIKPRCHIHIVS